MAIVPIRDLLKNLQEDLSTASEALENREVDKAQGLVNTCLSSLNESDQAQQAEYLDIVDEAIWSAIDYYEWKRDEEAGICYDSESAANIEEAVYNIGKRSYDLYKSIGLIDEREEPDSELE